MLMNEMPFLAVPGAFQAADRAIDSQEFASLTRNCEEKLSMGAIDEALLYAQKASILYGVSGLLLYFPLGYERILQEQKEGELIDQALVQILALVLFAKHWLTNQDTNEFTQEQVLETLDGWKTRFLELTNAADLVLSEATYLMSYYAEKAFISGSDANNRHS